MIADYAFYIASFYGDKIPEDSFPKYATRADAYLDELTMGRYADESLGDDIKEAVRMAECAAAEQCFQADMTAEQAAAAGTDLAAVSSETVGEHSVHFRSAEELDRQKESSVRRVIQRYLARTGLLYRGIAHVRSTYSISD